MDIQILLNMNIKIYGRVNCFRWLLMFSFHQNLCFSFQHRYEFEKGNLFPRLPWWTLSKKSFLIKEHRMVSMNSVKMIIVWTCYSEPWNVKRHHMVFLNSTVVPFIMVGVVEYSGKEIFTSLNLPCSQPKLHSSQGECCVSSKSETYGQKLKNIIYIKQEQGLIAGPLK